MLKKRSVFSYFSSQAAKLHSHLKWATDPGTKHVLYALPSLSTIISIVALCISAYCLYRIQTSLLLIMALTRGPKLCEAFVITLPPPSNSLVNSNNNDANGLPHVLSIGAGISMSILSLVLIIHLFKLIRNYLRRPTNGIYLQLLTPTSQALIHLYSIKAYAGQLIMSTNPNLISVHTLQSWGTHVSCTYHGFAISHRINQAERLTLPDTVKIPQRNYPKIRKILAGSHDKYIFLYRHGIPTKLSMDTHDDDSD